MSDVCRKIKEEIDRKDMSLSKVMAAADLGVSVFYKWKDGSSTPRPRSIRAIAKALGVPASTLSAELTDDVEVVASVTPGNDTDAEGIVEDFAFIGIRKSALNTLRPFLERANAGLIEVPEDLVKGLVTLIRPVGVPCCDDFSLCVGL